MDRRISLFRDIFLILLPLGIVCAFVIAYFPPQKAAPIVVSAAEPAATSTFSNPEIWKTASGKKPQFIVFAFDGSRSLDMWEDTRAFAAEMNAAGKPLHFTYFINAAYFLGKENAGKYQAPHHGKGESAIGFGGAPSEIAERIAEVNSAHAEGHEIGSHTVAHFGGSGWSADDWKREFGSFSDIMGNLPAWNLALTATTSLSFDISAIRGFRAPELGVSPGLYDALPAFHFRYDASANALAGAWPYKLPTGLWEFPLGSIRVAGRWMLAMDFNFFVNQTGGQSILRKGTPEWDKKYQDLMAAYQEYFRGNYESNRAPIYVANHFSEWNDRLYWEVMKDFAREECGKPETYCVNYSELADALDAAPAGTVLK